MARTKMRIVLPVIVAALSFCFTPEALAQSDEWKFGIGTGLNSFSIDGDIGFSPASGGVIVEIDLDNSDTSDLFKSAFGFGGFAAKGDWRILYAAGRVTLEDDDGGLDAEWDRDLIEVAGVYIFARPGRQALGVLFGARYIAHDWEFTLGAESADVDDDWTDGLVGFTYDLAFTDHWTWANRVDAGFGDSEGSYLLTSTFNWKPGEHWVLNLGLRVHSIDFGDEDDIDDSDFYLYDADEPGVTIGFLYTW